MNIKKSLNPTHIKDNIIGLIKSVPQLLKTIYLFMTFFLLLIFYLVALFHKFFKKIPLIKIIALKVEQIWNRFFARFFDRLVEKIEGHRPSEVRTVYLIDLAFRSMMTKKVRSLITMLGMSVGVGVIVLLLSLGYGVERLIIGRVARLDELRMVDVSAGDNTSLRLNKQSLEKIKKIKKVEKVLPLISVVGRLSFKRATTDVLVYATPRDYLNTLQIKIKKGKLFANNNSVEEKIPEVAGLQTKFEEQKFDQPTNGQTVVFNIYPEKSAVIWNSCSIDSKILGYINRIEGSYYQGVEYWGGDYSPFGSGGRVAYDKEKEMYLGRWIKTKLPLFEKKEDESLMKMVDSQGNQRWENGCVQEKDIVIRGKIESGSVLGESTSSVAGEASASAEVFTASSSATAVDFVTVASDSSGLETVVMTSSASAAKKEVGQLKFAKPPDGQAVVSSGLLNLLSIPENKAIGTTFKTSFIIVKSLIPEIDGRALTTEVEYKIIGVIDDPDNTYFYIPFSDIYRIGVKNFSQLRVLLTNREVMMQIRKQIEAIGFRTNSAVDTVKQIEGLFANLRIVLAILGMVALGVASLGMFNTLTVSLLERTREIGGMKAMGMVSDEVQDLFLAEAMIMGLGGGIGGLLLGYLGGELISLVISIFAISAGQGYIHVNYLPIYFVMFILICSFVVGLFTGLYPARRAKKISALNALRYE